MQLARFIRKEVDPILQRWQECSPTLYPHFALDKERLRDRARNALITMADDLEPGAPASQLPDRPNKPADIKAQPGVASTVAELSAQESDIENTFSVLRGLRASVLELWTKDIGTITEEQFDELTRFNDAVDQVVAQALERQAGEHERRSRLFGAIMLGSPDPIFVFDTEGRFTHINQTALELYGFPARTIIGKNAFELGLSFATELQEGLGQVRKTKKIVRGELTHVVANGLGEKFNYLLTPVLNARDELEAVVCMAQNVTERMNAEEKAWHNANYDRLTGLPNRRLFRDRLRQEVKGSIRTGRPLALLVIDLERLKSMNRALGRQAGDQVLCDVAERIHHCIRETDTAARLDQDDFAVVLTSLQEGQSEYLNVDALAQKIDRALAEPFYVASNTMHVPAKVGIALCPKDASTAVDLLRKADHALKKAAQQGKGRICFYHSDDGAS